ncbi:MULTISPECIES: GntR family transcriptional regulator [unclassified Leisingera]|uniref:GntR family transcriptional regulator n=1 Tax=unclassified Leisingera TaxID=2614906 RepID=UPI0002EDB114|nr:MULTISPECIES: GntR family transcriptional regulator [unclassified Leisingera]KIC21080.1 GntR family transcriptional regulator [Leisingera sp. ANG-S3]KIC54005.1 GntR family transcriptional regulator [Leisingera sp. ANG-S]KID09635.1 GntR family transcriptional regulator [Leisingera sp. ANG1]
MSADATLLTPPGWGDRKPGVEDIQRLILKRICFLEYTPGDRLKEAELAKEFGVSRTPVRDAISRINHLGLVETINGVGNVVMELPPQKIAQVYEMRLHLAALIGATTPAQIEESHQDRARDLLQQAHLLGDQVDSRQYVIVNDQLNTLISDLIGNSVLRSFWTQAYYQAASTWHRVVDRAGAEVADALVAELVDLENALAENDILAVGYIQRIHIGYGYARIKKFMFRETDL